MTVIATNTVRPHLGKAKLQLNNMLEVTKAFGDMGITCLLYTSPSPRDY